MIRVLLITVLLSGCAAERQVSKEQPVPVLITIGIFSLAASVISNGDV